MDFFSLLREHARLRTEAPAVSSPRRSMTYRKLWSRIERATARLQCEWGVAQGDTLAYLGKSHPDALVLYFSAARCGACLLPLSPDLSDIDRTRFIEKFRARLLIVDDDLHATLTSPAHSLSSLIATRCPQQPKEVVEDMCRPTLLCSSPEHPPGLHAFSLAELRNQRETQADAQSLSEGRIETLFERETFSLAVLPSLQNGACLILP